MGSEMCIRDSVCAVPLAMTGAVDNALITATGAVGMRIVGTVTAAVVCAVPLAIACTIDNGVITATGAVGVGVVVAIARSVYNRRRSVNMHGRVRMGSTMRVHHDWNR